MSVVSVYSAPNLTMVISGMWSSPQITGQAPPPCNRFTITTVGDKGAIMFGGWSGLTVLDDLFFLALGRHSVVSLHACGSTYCLIKYYGY